MSLNLNPVWLVDNWLWFLGGVSGLALLGQFANAWNAWKQRKLLGEIRDELRGMRRK